LTLYDGPDALIVRRKERTPLDNKTDNERVCLRQIQRTLTRLVGRKSIPTTRRNKPCKRAIPNKGTMLSRVHYRITTKTDPVMWKMQNLSVKVLTLLFTIVKLKPLYHLEHLNDNTFLDICVLNVTRAEGTTASASAQPIADLAPPQIPSNSLVNNPEMINPNFNQDASVPNSPIPGGTGSTIAGTVGTFVPASIGEFYKICSFGHSEVPGVPATGGITYQIWVDGILLMEWADFQWSPVTPKIDQWKFDVPLFVEKQIVLRVINRTGDAGAATDITTGEIEACFAGWSEQKMGFLETDKVQIQNVAN